jgi:iron complex transport system ATP-binding protein
MTALTASDIAVRFGPTPILAGADFSLVEGEVVGLIGPNGAGKTTLLRVLAGLLTPDRGEVRLHGRALAGFDRHARARALAYLAQDGESHWAVTVETLVTLGRLPHMGPWRGPSPADHAAVGRALAACDATTIADRPVNRLSGGERARVLLARALAVESSVLLADEPVAGLDPAHALDVMTVLRSRAREGAAVVAVIHDLTVAIRHCDRLVLLAQGTTMAEGPPGDVLSEENLARAYGIRAYRGIADGQPFVVPLARTGVGDAP